MKTKRSLRLRLLPLLLTAGLATGCPSAEEADASAAGRDAPGDGSPDGGSADAEPTFRWARALDAEYGFYNIASTVTPNGDVVLVGATEEATPVTFDALTLTPSTKLVLFAARFGADGTPLDLREIGHMVDGQYILQIDGLVADPDGGFFVAGNFSGSLALPDGTPVNESGTSYVIHCKADGTEQSYDVGYGDLRPAIDVDRQGNLAVTTGYRTLGGKNGVDGELSLRVFAPDGSIRWERDINGNLDLEEAFFPKVRFAPDGSVVWAGGVGGRFLKFAGTTAEDQYIPIGGVDALFVAKYSPEGVPYFEDGYDPYHTDIATVRGLHVDDDGGVYLWFNLDDGGVDFGVDGWRTDIYYYHGFVKFDPQGVPQWLVRLSQGGIGAMAGAPGGRLVFSGSASGPVVALDGTDASVNFEAGDGNSRVDGILVFVDTAGGRVAGVDSYGDAFDQSFFGLSTNRAGAFAVLGTASGSMQLGGLTFGDASKPGSRTFLTSGTF